MLSLLAPSEQVSLKTLQDLPQTWLPWLPSFWWGLVDLQWTLWHQQQHVCANSTSLSSSLPTSAKHIDGSVSIRTHWLIKPNILHKHHISLTKFRVAECISTNLPGIEVKGSQLAKVGIRHVHIEGLWLIYESSTISSHIHQCALLQLPDRLVQGLQVIGNIQPLSRQLENVKMTVSATKIMMWSN